MLTSLCTCRGSLLCGRPSSWPCERQPPAASPWRAHLSTATPNLHHPDLCGSAGGAGCWCQPASAPVGARCCAADHQAGPARDSHQQPAPIYAEQHPCCTSLTSLAVQEAQAVGADEPVHLSGLDAVQPTTKLALPEAATSSQPLESRSASRDPRSAATAQPEHAPTVPADKAATAQPGQGDTASAEKAATAQPEPEGWGEPHGLELVLVAGECCSCCVSGPSVCALVAGRPQEPRAAFALSVHCDRQPQLAWPTACIQ